MNRKIIAIFMILLFLGVGLVFPSNAEITKKKSNVTDDSKLGFYPPEIDFVTYNGCRKTILGYKVSFLVTTSDPDGDIISCYYRKYPDDFFHYAGSLRSQATFFVSWRIEEGSYIAHFVVRDTDNNFSDEVTISYNVPKPRVRISDFIFSLQDLLNPIFFSMIKPL